MSAMATYHLRSQIIKYLLIFYFSIDNSIYIVYTIIEVKELNAVIQKWGNSNGIRIPKHILNSVSLDVNDVVEISIDEDKIIIQKHESKRHVTLAERLKNYNGNYVFEECDWGIPVGNEVVK